jgi:tape measure domain-containing protein
MKTATSSLKDFSTEIKGGFAFGVMAKAGASAFSAISGSVSGLAKEAVETSDAMQKLQQAMKFSGDYSDKEIEKIAGLNGTLKKYADETVFDLNDVMSTFGALSANGIKDADNLTKSVGNAVAVFGGGAQEYSSVALAFSQAMASGKLQAEDWNQILNASPQLAGGLRKELMKLNPKLKKDFKGAMADGAISADLLGKAMNNIGMTKMAKEAATSVTTFEGAMGNLEATVSGGLLTLYDSFAKAGLISAINTLNGKLEEGFSWAASGFSKFAKKIKPYWTALKKNVGQISKAFGEAFSAIGDSFSELTGSFGSKDSVSGFSDVIGGITDALKSFAGFLKDHSDIIAKAISKLPKLLVAYKGFKIVKTLVPGVKAFSGAIVKMAGKGIGAIAGKLFGIAAGEEATGAASSASAKQVLTSAVAFIALGAGVALAGVGLALIAQAAIALADQGALAVGVMGGLVVALAGLAFGASIIGPALTAGAVGFVAFGAAMVLVGAGMALAAGFVKNLVPLVKQVGDTAAQMAGAFAAAAATVIGSVGELVGNIADGVSQIVTCIGEELCNVFETAGNAISGVVDSISGGIATVVDAISGGFRSVLDGIAGVIESIGTSARNAGQGFELVAEGISLIAGLSLLDIAKSLGAVAVGIGEISLAGEGMGVIGDGVQSIATAIQALSVGQVILASMAQSGDMASQAAVGYYVLASAIQEIATVSAGVLAAAVSLQSLMSAAITSSTAIVALGTALMTASGAARSASAGVLSVSGSLNGVARSGGAAVGAVRRLAGAARNAAAAIHPIGAAAQQAASALIRSFSAAATKAKAAGNAIGKGVLTSVRQGMKPLPKIADQAMNSLVGAIKSGGSRATASARSAASSIVSTLRHAAPGATSAGRYIGMGLANGMASQLGRVRSVAAQLASAAERAIRAKARIHSPSKVSHALGEYWGTGYALGISSMVQSTRKAAERLVTVPTLAAGPDLSYHGRLEQDFDYYRNAQYTIQVPVTVDGREFARATATYTQEELNKRQTRDSRKRGIL